MSTMVETRSAAAPYLPPDTPIWRSEYTTGKYRYLEHQRGVIGILKIRLSEGRELGRGLDAARRRTVSPQVVIKVGGEQERSSVAARNHSPSWNERFVLPVRKGSVQEGAPVLVVFEVLDAGWIPGKGRSLGVCSVDVVPLLNGSKGSHVIEGWLPLSPEGGSLRVVVEYEPHGLEPREGDVVFFEAFARSHRSLVFPPNEPMVVKALSGAHLLVSMRTRSSRESPTLQLLDAGLHEIRVKVHRNTVFVIERLTLADAAWCRAMSATERLAGTPPVKWTRKKLQPYFRYISAISRPALTTLHIAYAAAKLAARSSMAAMSGATSTFLGLAEEPTPFAESE